MIRAVHRQTLDVKIERAKPLVYDEGGNAFLDRPPHVRAGSGLVVLGGAAWVVQDDTLFLARVDLALGSVRAVALPAGAGGVRQFDEERGNKKDKLDLDCMVPLSSTTLLAIGSGSTPARRQLLRIEVPSGTTHQIDASAFYASLESAAEFAGAELNLEGALLLPDRRLRLFQRGNGAAKNGRVPQDATCEVDLDDALGNRPAHPREIRVYDLGALDGVRLTFTDAAFDGAGRPHYLAAAEDSPNTYEDGETKGCVLGRLAADGAAEFGRVFEADGTPSKRKLEGLAWDAGHSRWIAVEDKDDPGHATEMVWISPQPATVSDAVKQ